MIVKLPLSELRDYDSYRMEGQGRRFVSELRRFEEFVKGCLPGVRRLADRQRSRGSAHKEKGYAKEKGQRSNENANKQFNHGRDRKGGKEMYRVTSGVMTANQLPVSQKSLPRETVRDHLRPLATLDLPAMIPSKSQMSVTVRPPR